MSKQYSCHINNEEIRYVKRSNGILVYIIFSYNTEDLIKKLHDQKVIFENYFKYSKFSQYIEVSNIGVIEMTMCENDLIKLKIMSEEI